MPDLSRTGVLEQGGGAPYFGDVGLEYSSGKLQLGHINSIIKFDFYRLQLAGPAVRLDQMSSSRLMVMCTDSGSTGVVSYPRRFLRKSFNDPPFLYLIVLQIHAMFYPESFQICRVSFWL